MKNIFRENQTTIQIISSKNPNYPAHIHDYIEIIYIIKGKGFGYCNDSKYNLKEGDFFLVFPNQIHHYSDFPPYSDCMMIIANPSVFPSYINIFNDKTPLCAKYESEKKDRNLMEIFKIIFDEHTKNTPIDVVVSIINAFLGMLIERYEFFETDSDNSCAYKIINYCKKHYQKELTIDTISKDLHISKSHISHTFNNKLKISFPNYINSLRLINAVNLLDKGKFTITEIAQRSGFQTIRSFNRVFLKHFGMSPREYLKKKF